MKIGVLNIYSFPQGLAPTNRILAYTKGLVEQNVECEILSLKPQVRTPNNINRIGSVNGVKYIHQIQIPLYKNRILNSLCFRLGNIICFWKSLWYIRRSKPKFDAMILSFDQPSLMLPIVIFLRLLNIRSIAIADEFPTPIRRKLKTHIPKWKEIAYNLISKSLSGRILMTEKLADFYNSIKPLPTLILSTITDVERFKYTHKDIRECDITPYFCYMGNMELSKDNVVNIINAFKIVHDKYPAYKFYLYGAPSSNDRKIIEQAIQNSNLKDIVVIKGLAPYEKVPKILASAKILVTSQPNTKRAEAWFPNQNGRIYDDGSSVYSY